jgi:signal transduction histidine kinase
VDGVAGTLRALLELAHCEGGLEGHPLEDVDVGGLLDAVADFFEPSAEARGLTLHRSYPPGLRLRGEPHWLRQLFANLVDNAIKFSERSGRVEIDAGALAMTSGACTTTGAASGHEGSFSCSSAARAAGAQCRPGLALARQIARAHGGGSSRHRGQG